MLEWKPEDNVVFLIAQYERLKSKGIIQFECPQITAQNAAKLSKKMFDAIADHSSLYINSEEEKLLNVNSMQSLIKKVKFDHAMGKNFVENFSFFLERNIKKRYEGREELNRHYRLMLIVYSRFINSGVEGISDLDKLKMALYARKISQFIW